jgi:hypothetical protein
VPSTIFVSIPLVSIAVLLINTQGKKPVVPSVKGQALMSEQAAIPRE